MRLRTKQRLDLYLGGVAVLLLKPWVRLLGLLFPRDHALRVGPTLAVIKMLGGGSLVIAFPALLGLRRRYPRTRMLLITSPSLRDFGRTLGVFDEVVVIDDHGPLRMILTALRALTRVLGADTVVDLEVYSILTTVFALLTCARNRISFYLENVFWRRHLATHMIYFNRFAGSYLFYEQIARALDAEPASAEECAVELKRLLADALRPCPPPAQGSPARIAVGAGCSDLVPERMLPPALWRRRFEERLKSVAAIEAHLLGGPKDRACAAQIIAETGDLGGRIRWVDHSGELALPESLSCLSSAEEFWGIDSSLLHYARLLGLRCESFWGPTDPATRLRPMPGLRERVHYRRLACSPCVHVAESPPCRGHNLCMQWLFNPPTETPEAPLWLVDSATEADLE